MENTPRERIMDINKKLYTISENDTFKIQSLVEKCVEKHGGTTSKLINYDNEKRIRFVTECGGSDEIIKNLEELLFLLKKVDYCNNYSSMYKKIINKFVHWISKKIR